LKIKSGQKYKILCDYKCVRDNEYLKAGSIVTVDCYVPWGNYGHSSIRYGVVQFKDCFRIFAHDFEMIAEEYDGGGNSEC
jgi:hypothetical protein